MASLEDRYRRLLFTYPKEYRREHEEEIASTLVDASGPGRRCPSVRETAGLIVGGLRIRGLLATRRGGSALSADGIRLAVVLLLGLRLMAYTQFIRVLPPTMAFLPATQLVSALLLSLAVVAVVRGATRSAFGLIVIGGVASQLPTGLFFPGQVGATPFSSTAALLALSAVLVVVQHRLDGSTRPWSWWLAAAILAAPMLSAQAHEFYMAYEAHNSVAVPCALVALALIGRDPRLSIAATVTTGVSLMATLCASLAFWLQWQVVPWISLWQVIALPSAIIAVCAITTVATLGTGLRLLRR